MSFNSPSALEASNNTLGKANHPSAEVNDFIFSFWHKSNWGELLQPAPMALLILSNLTVVAAADDFKLVAPRDGFEHLKYPDSFRATIIHLVDSGVDALQKSCVNFDEIQKHCAGVQPGVNSIFELLAGMGAESEQEMNDNIRRHLPSHVARLQGVIQTCLPKAKEMDNLFQELLYLTMEIHESCSAMLGETSAKVSEATMRQSVFRAKKPAAEANTQLAQRQVEDARALFSEAREQFNNAAHSMPPGLGRVGVEFVAGISKAIVDDFNTEFNLLFGRRAMVRRYQTMMINAAGGVPTMPGASAIPESSGDRAYGKSPLIYKAILSLENLATGGENGGVDWDKVSATDAGAAWLRNYMRATLDSDWGSGEPDKQAKELLERGIKLAQGLQDAAPTKNEEVIKNLVHSIQLLFSEATIFAITAMSKAGASAMQNPGFATPSQAPSIMSDSAVQMQSEQIRIDVTQKQLDASRTMLEHATDRLLDVTTETGEVMGQISSLSMQTMDWERHRTILLRAIAFLCQLKGCLATLVHFFDSINNLVSIALNESVAQFIQLITDATKPEAGSPDKSVAGISFSNWTRQSVYNQALGAAKVARLVQNIAEIYLKMYEGRIQGGVQKVLLVGQHMDTPDSQHKEPQTAVQEIEGWARQASAGIAEVLKMAQAKMLGDMDEHMAQLQKDLGGILPPPPTPVKHATADVTKAGPGSKAPA